MEENAEKPTLETALLLRKLTETLQYLLVVTALILPAFFTPLTQDWFEINKQVLVVAVTLLGYVLWTSKMVLMGEVRLIRTRVGLPVILFILAILLSLLISPSKYVTLTSPAAWSLLALPFLYFLYLNNLPSRKSLILTLGSLLTITTALSVLALYERGLEIGLWTQPLGFPRIDFTPAGSVINLNALQIFTLAAGGVLALRLKGRFPKALLASVSLVSLVTLLLTNPLSNPNGPLMLSLSDSWQIAFETIKVSPLVGSGPGKYVESFMRFKPLSFNQSDSWGVNFGSASNAFLQILTVTGLLGFIAFGITLLAAAYSLKEAFPPRGKAEEAPEAADNSSRDALLEALGAGLLTALILVVVFPYTTTILFLFFISAALFEKQRFLLRNKPGQEVQVWVLTLPVEEGSDQVHQPQDAPSEAVSKAGLAKALLILAAGGSVLGFYGLSRVYAAEVKFNESLKMAREQNGTQTYRLQQEAIRLNPFEARYHVSYANTNLGLANALAGRNQGQLSDEDSRNIGILINQAVREAKRAVALAPNNSAYWENMGNIYRDLRGVASGAENWAISSYTQAISLNPFNPRLRVSLGGIYYGLKDYDSALTAFQDAVRLKGDYANAYYNLAWTLRQLERYPQAVQAMEQALKYTDEASDDYARAQGELEQFKQLAQAQGPLAEEQQQSGVLGEQLEATPSSQPEIPQPEISQEESSPSAEVKVGEEEEVNETFPPTNEE